MPEPYTANDLLNAIAVASKTLSERKDEINRLNVFPVPDGDTGTNMSLTLETVVENLANLPIGAAGDFGKRLLWRNLGQARAVTAALRIACTLLLMRPAQINAVYWSYKRSLNPP